MTVFFDQAKKDTLEWPEAFKILKISRAKEKA